MTQAEQHEIERLQAEIVQLQQDIADGLMVLLVAEGGTRLLIADMQPKATKAATMGGAIADVIAFKKAERVLRDIVHAREVISAHAHTTHVHPAPTGEL